VPVPGDDPTEWRSGLRRLLSRELVRAGVVTYAFSGLTLAASLVSGVISARALGPSGRGVAVALVTVAQLAGFLLSLGVSKSLSYFIARRPQDGPALLTTWSLMLVPLAAVAVGGAELLLPVIFSADDPQAVEIGRWFMLTIVLVVGLELNGGLLLGAHDYLAFNALRFAQAAIMALSFAVLWPLDALTVTSALIAPTVGSALVLSAGMARSVRRLGLGPVHPRLGLRTLWYGVRGHGVMVAATVNARLDVAMLPAFVAAASVGLYSVATNVSLIVFQLASTFAALVLPAAARDPARGPAKVLGSLHATVAIAGVLALAIGVLAGPLLGIVYGGEFRAAAGSLQLLLPGAVLFAGASIVTSGLYAAGRPFTAAVPQLAGMAVTVAGLLLFLPSGGVTAAAIVSSVSYATVFATSLVAYKAVARIPWGGFVPTPARVRALVG
jgi:O-antigen/teichoic acid export membrane protein